MNTNDDYLNGIAVFVRVIETGSFTQAAESLGHSTSYVSKEVTKLENRLGIRLINRTTRKLSLTDLGRNYFDSCSQIADIAKDAERNINEKHETPSGLIKISAPISFGMSHLQPILPLFMETYPSVQLEVDYSEFKQDIVAEGFDVVVRIGTLKDSNLIFRKITSSKGVTVASPSYLQRKGYPSHPSQLVNHDYICYSFTQAPQRWEYQSISGECISVHLPQPKVTTNNAEAELKFALAGIGITRLPYFCCEKELESGKLVLLFNEFKDINLDVFAIFPHRKHLPATTRAFVDFLVSQLKNQNV
ncbi:MAG: LysR family transcriptional regulator [Bermanella sp.]